MEIHFKSEALYQNVGLNVILPDESYLHGGKVKYPVLYLLHGLSDDYTCWQRLSSVERYARENGIAVVMPDGGINFYSDNKKANRNYYTLVAKEIPAFCERNFACISTKREDTFVAGLSMGGYGALKLALSMPEKFSSVAAFSSVADIVSCVKAEMIRNGEFWNYIFEDVNSLEGSCDDLFALADKCGPKKSPQIYMWCGTEDSLCRSNDKLAAYLTQNKFPITYETSHGNHSWKYWDEQLERAIRRMAESRKNNT